jgi:hypothetical protein
VTAFGLELGLPSGLVGPREIGVLGPDRLGVVEREDRGILVAAASAPLQPLREGSVQTSSVTSRERAVRDLSKRDR